MIEVRATDGALAGSPGALQRLERRFELTTKPVKVGRHRLVMPELSDPVSYIEARMGSTVAKVNDLPFWTKVWPASVVLAAFVESHVRPDAAPLLELGAGLGLPGLVAALNGRNVVLTDLDPDALEFARAAVELNHLEAQVAVVPLDWSAPSLDVDPYTTILGSEILFERLRYPLLVELLSRTLAPEGRAFLSHEERPFGISFFRLAQSRFSIRSTSCTVRSATGGREATRVFIHALARRDVAPTAAH